MYSKCCGASSSDLSDELCGECLEHTDFYDEEIEGLDEELSSEELSELMNEFYNN